MSLHLFDLTVIYLVKLQYSKILILLGVETISSFLSEVTKKLKLSAI